MTTPDKTHSDATGITIIRTLPATPDRVVRAWTDVTWFVRWFGQPHGVLPLETASMDARPGGKWSIVMHVGEEMRLRFHGSFVAISPERIAMTLTDEPTEEGAAPLTIDLAPTGDSRTVMTFHQAASGLTEDQLAGAREGWAGFFAHMAEVVAAGE